MIRSNVMEVWHFCVNWFFENVKHVYTVFRSDLLPSVPLLLPLNLSPSHPSNVMFSIFCRNLEAKLVLSKCAWVWNSILLKRNSLHIVFWDKRFDKIFSSFLFVNNSTHKCLFLFLFLFVIKHCAFPLSVNQTCHTHAFMEFWCNYLFL